MDIVNTENQMQKHLDRLLRSDVPDEFGASFVQRLLGISYNNAMNVLDLGLSKGKIVIGNEQWLYLIAPNDAANRMAATQNEQESTTDE